MPEPNALAYRSNSSKIFFAELSMDEVAASVQGATTLSITTLSITALSIKGLDVTLGIIDAQR